MEKQRRIFCKVVSKKFLFVSTQPTRNEDARRGGWKFQYILLEEISQTEHTKVEFQISFSPTNPDFYIENVCSQAIEVFIEAHGGQEALKGKEITISHILDNRRIHDPGLIDGGVLDAIHKKIKRLFKLFSSLPLNSKGFPYDHDALFGTFTFFDKGPV